MNYNNINIAEALKTNTSQVIEKIDKVLQFQPTGSILSPITAAYRGLNHRITPTQIPNNKEHFGLTLFTRPQLNMSTDNLRMVRQLTPLLTSNPHGLGRIIRCLLDPQLEVSEGITSPLVDNNMAFIPIFTESLISLNGWPDIVAPTFTSNEGQYKETYTMVDGIADINGSFDLSANFKNIMDDPITIMLLVWIYYMCAVFEGNMVPRPRFIVQNTVDYQTRIWRLVLDNTKTRVLKIGCCGVAIPTATPIGAAFNYESDRPLNGANEQISTRFTCNGARYMDPILVKTFNQTVWYFNNNMHDSRRSNMLVKVPLEALPLFNHQGYPRINPETWELEWYVSAKVYQSILPDDDAPVTDSRVGLDKLTVI